MIASCSNALRNGKGRSIFDCYKSVEFPPRRTHIRSRSDATGLLLSPNNPVAGVAGHPGSLLSAPATATARKRLHLGDLTSGRAFDNGCACFESRVAAVNDLRGERTACSCGAPRLAPQQEFIRALISIGKRLSSQSLPTKVRFHTAIASAQLILVVE